MSSNDDYETWTDDDTAPVPSRVFKKGALLVDREISKRLSAVRAPRIQDYLHPYAIGFGRRALEIAITSAVNASSEHPSRQNWEPAWVEMRDTSRAAQRSLKKLFDRFDRRGSSAKFLVPFLAQSRLDRQSDLTIQQRHRQAKRDALILVAAHRIVKNLASDTERRRALFVQVHPGGNTDFEKNAFVQALAEAWIFLTARKPGASPDVEGNPFLQFVEASWQDWRGEQAIWEDENRRVSFVAALNSVLNRISSEEASWLISNGPTWKYSYPNFWSA